MTVVAAEFVVAELRAHLRAELERDISELQESARRWRLLSVDRKSAMTIFEDAMRERRR